MDVFAKVMPWLVGAMILLVAILAFGKPLECLLRLIGRTGVGLGTLVLFAPLGGFLGVNLGVNLINALVLGTLGVPGFGLLLMVNWALGG